jgi:hypothetical protein
MVEGRRRLVFAASIYLLLAVAYFAMMPERTATHTRYNHYALQAEAWLNGRFDLGGPPPAYTGNNDFAVYEEKHYVSFPPVPSLLLVPFVAAAGGAETVADGLIFTGLAPLGPMLFFLALERQRKKKGSAWQSALLALVLGLGTVYWFSAVQGTVWFAGHVMTMALCCAYILFSIEAAHPVLAGIAWGLAVGTRPTLIFALPLFVHAACRRADKMLRFAVPAALIVAGLAWYNYARFGDPTEFGHHMLNIRWTERIERWGLFSFHYLGRNLTVLLAGLPFRTAEGWQVNAHGLALWLTTPVFLFAFWPKRASGAYWVAAACALAVAVPSLLYQNTGWIQFGYRFSNDFAPFLLLMIALGGRRLAWPFWGLAAVGLLINGFGALTFGKADYRSVYFIDPTQKILVQPD